MDTFFPGVDPKVPIYQLLVPHFLDDDSYHEANEQMAAEGEPSEHMAPLNEAARQRCQAMLDRLDAEAKKMADLVGRPYRGRLNDLGDLIAQSTADAKILRDRAEAAKRQIPTVPTEAIPMQPALVPLAVRRQRTLAKSGVKGSRKAPPQNTRPVQRPIHEMTTENRVQAPLQGEQ